MEKVPSLAEAFSEFQKKDASTPSRASPHAPLSPHRRRVALRSWGERITPGLLRNAGFEQVEDLNNRVFNLPFADFLARRAGRRYLIGVKTHNKFRTSGGLNGEYNVWKKGKDLQPLAKEYGAERAWLAIQVEPEAQRYSAYFGTIDQIEHKGERYSIPMTEARTARTNAWLPA